MRLVLLIFLVLVSCRKNDSSEEFGHTCKPPSSVWNEIYLKNQVDLRSITFESGQKTYNMRKTYTNELGIYICITELTITGDEKSGYFTPYWDENYPENMILTSEQSDLCYSLVESKTFNYRFTCDSFTTCNANDPSDCEYYK